MSTPTDSQTKANRGRPKKLDRERVIQVAVNAYWQQGMFAFSINELCQKAEVSKPALYREFGSEDGLILAVLEHYYQNNMLPLWSGLKPELSFQEVMTGAINHLTSDRGTPAGCLFTRMRLSNNRLGPLTANRVKELATEQRQAYQAWYESGLKKGETNDALTPEFAAQFLDTQFASILVQMSEGVDPSFVNEQAKLAMSPLLKKE